jgi:hypothetical protein
MTRPSREDMIILSMGISTLLACIRQTEVWWRAEGDGASLRRSRLLTHAVLATRRKFFGHSASDEVTDDITEALFIADGLRDGAQQCREGQSALHQQLLRGAEAIERLCGHRSGRGQSS